ncbi:MAG: prolipoprotein diacylglyceryl transferase [Chloroflexi bacterium]|nr:prolipoprotein diacylglyceryl transferase [Chloroflexota bacterium]
MYWYGIIVTLGIMAGVWWAAREIDKRGQSVDDLLNGAILVIFSGYIFARLTYVILDVIGGGRYDSLLDVINIRAGGVNILGGFIGAALVGWSYMKWRRLKVWHYADAAGPALLLAQAIGRWGNFVNQELYGPPTDLPWGILIDAPAPHGALPEFARIPAGNNPLPPHFSLRIAGPVHWLYIAGLAKRPLSRHLGARHNLWSLPHLVGRQPRLD